MLVVLNGRSGELWAVTAPIFIPMLMLVGYVPETIQAEYRIGDSATSLGCNFCAHQ